MTDRVAPGRRPIRRLDPSVVERIAAGEVVERPSSVVKELIENSLDAGARHISVRLERGGLDRIEVADDGVGIPAEEIELALERHATSKLDPNGDLSSIATLGFRGEALASVAAVARLELASRAEGADRATVVAYEGGRRVGRHEASRAVGTTVVVRDLFFNTPARRKFLRSPAAELVEVSATIERAYLARFGVTFEVEVDGNPVGVYPAVSTLAEAADRLFGSDFARHRLAVRAALPTGGRVDAVVGEPAVHASSARRLLVTLNGRPIVSRSLQQAVRLAYEGYLPRTRYPVGALSIELPADRVDVNVHPTKREVRIERDRDVAETVRRVVRDGLTSAPRTAEAPRRPTVSPAPSPLRPPPARSAPGASWRTDRPTNAAPSRSAAAPLGSMRTRGLRPLDSGAPGAIVPAGPGRPTIRLIGSFGSLYWIGEADDRLCLVDQHAASERLIYERLLRHELPARQELLVPLTIELSVRERAVLAAADERVRDAGFEVTAFGPTTVRLRALPAWFGERARPVDLKALLGELADGGRPTVPDGARERTAATLACHSALRAGDSVEGREIERILVALDRLPEPPYACPHGRPIVHTIRRSEIDRWFLRRGA